MAKWISRIVRILAASANRAESRSPTKLHPAPAGSCDCQNGTHAAALSSVNGHCKGSHRSNGRSTQATLVHASNQEGDFDASCRGSFLPTRKCQFKLRQTESCLDFVSVLEFGRFGISQRTSKIESVCRSKFLRALFLRRWHRRCSKVVSNEHLLHPASLKCRDPGDDCCNLDHDVCLST